MSEFFTNSSSHQIREIPAECDRPGTNSEPGLFSAPQLHDRTAGQHVRHLLVDHLVRGPGVQLGPGQYPPGRSYFELSAVTSDNLECLVVLRNGPPIVVNLVGSVAIYNSSEKNLSLLS